MEKGRLGKEERKRKRNVHVEKGEEEGERSKCLDYMEKSLWEKGSPALGLGEGYPKTPAVYARLGWELGVSSDQSRSESLSSGNVYSD